jgi:hypothetical protein
MIDDIVRPSDREAFFFTHIFQPDEDERIKEIDKMFKKHSMLLNKASRNMV